eukprot:Clim_evm9s23 gene=Clim_evmTU9s23
MADIKLIFAVQDGKAEEVTDLLQRGAGVTAADTEGRTALMFACARNDATLVRLLLAKGAVWNALDKHGNSAGDYAIGNKAEDAYQVLLNHAVSAELIFAAMGKSQVGKSGDSGSGDAKGEDGYLKQSLKYSEGRLVDADGHGVMMGWETPIMRRSAEIIAPTEDLTVINIGFGLGIIDSELQQKDPSKHVIVEAHPDVLAHMKEQGWMEKQNVVVIKGRWQDNIEEIQSHGPYDGIYFDTYAESYADMRAFHDEMVNVLAEDGTYCFFNGMAATNQFFYDVCTTVAELEMKQLGMKMEIETIPVDWNVEEEWDGIKQVYWRLKTYKLPKCTFHL